MAKQTVFETAFSQFLDKLSPEEARDFKHHGTTTIEDLWKEVETANENHLRRSIYRKTMEKFDKTWSILSPIVDVVTPALGASEAAAVSLGIIRAVAMLACRVNKSFESLTATMTSLYGQLRTLDFYSECAQDDKLISDVVIAIYVDLLEFYRGARNVYLNSQGKYRRLGFSWTSFDSRFGEIVKNIDLHMQCLRDRVQASTFERVRSLQVRSLNTVEKSTKDDEDACMASLYIDNAEAFLFKKDSQIEGTCEWMFDGSESRFMDWLNKPNKTFLVLLGDKFCGKTMIASYVVNYLKGIVERDALKTKYIVASYFFSENPGVEKEDATLMLRGLLYQVFDQHGEMIKLYALKHFKQQQGKMATSFLQLWTIMLCIIKHVPELRIYIVLDGIEWCDEDTRRKVFKEFDSVSKTHAGLKIMLTVRKPDFYSLDLRISPVQVDLDPFIEKDLERIVRTRLTEMWPQRPLSTELQVKLASKILEQANGCTLWANIILRVIEHSRNLPPRKLEALVSHRSPSLDEIYFKMLNEIDEEQSEEASKILRIIVGARRPLSMDELRHALAVDKDCLDLDDVEENTPPNFEDYIKTVLGPLVRIVDSRVGLLHDSFGEFLRNIANRGSDPKGESPQDRNLRVRFDCSDPSAHTVMVTCCILYFKLKDFKQEDFVVGSVLEDLSLYDFDEVESLVTANGTNPQLDDISSKCFFFGYAATYWADHLRLSGSQEPDLLAAVMELTQQERLRHRIYEQYKSSFSNWGRHLLDSEYFIQPDELNQLNLHAYFGHDSILKSLMNARQIRKDESQLMTGFKWAARKGYLKCLTLLFDAVSQPDIHREALHKSLFYASKYDRIDLLNMLFQKYSDHICIENTKVDGYTALEIAVDQGHFEAVKFWLSNVEEPHQTIKSILLMATPVKRWTDVPEIRESRRRIFDLALRDDRVDIAIRDKGGRTVLSWAAEEGCVESVSLLMSHGTRPDIQPIQKSLLSDRGDRSGCTPVWYAAKWNRADVLKRLNAAGDIRAQIAERGPEGENAFCIAAKCGSLDALKVMADLDTEGESIDQPGDDLRTPLSIAAISDRSAEDIATVLLRSGKVNVDARNESGHSALWFAVKAARLGMMRVLILEGKADFDGVAEVDEKGRVVWFDRPSADWDADAVGDELQRIITSRTAAKATPGAQEIFLDTH